jgi:Protein of unknown function (DUF1616)
MWYSPVQAIVGLLLLFVVPGFFTTRALFPEWRLTGADALIRWVETAALSLVLSVAYTVLVGSVLLNLGGAGFSASWSDPTLEGGLLAVSGVGAGLAVARGGFSRTPPKAPALEPSGGEEGAWELVQRGEELARRERRLRHALRTARDPAESERIRSELEGVGRERESLRQAREAEYAV